MNYIIQPRPDLMDQKYLLHTIFCTIGMRCWLAEYARIIIACQY